MGESAEICWLSHLGLEGGLTMASQTDTLKIARADIVTIGNKIATAQQGRIFGQLDPKITIRRAVQMMEQTTRRLRKSFKLEG